jgi:hypothetical protein
MQILFFEIYKRGHFNVQGTRHSPSTLPTMVLGQDFRIVIRPLPYREGILYLLHGDAIITLFNPA